MIRFLALLAMAWTTTMAFAQDHAAHGHEQASQDTQSDEMDHSTMDHSTMDHSSMGHSMEGAKVEEEDAPSRAKSGPRYAADSIWSEQAMADARQELYRSHGGGKFGSLRVDRAEARLGEGLESYLWDLEGFYGSDLSKLWIKLEGEGEFDGNVEDAEIQALYSRAISPFFDLQLGARLDIEPETRSHLVLGVQGTAPYWLHVDLAGFLSNQGDLTGRIEVEYDQKITQQLILQPRIEAEISVQDIAEREIGAGLYKIEPGLRLRYEFVPEFAPYIGIDYEAKLGESADLARADGEDADGFKFLIGLRAWF